MSHYDGISLSEAISDGQLEQFIRDSENRLKELGYPRPPEAKEVEAALEAAIKKQQSEDRT